MAQAILNALHIRETKTVSLNTPLSIKNSEPILEPGLRFASRRQCSKSAGPNTTKKTITTESNC